MTTKPKRGGAREGAGLKTSDATTVLRYNVMLDKESAKLAKLLGGGNLSLGLRAAIRLLHEYRLVPIKPDRVYSQAP